MIEEKKNKGQMIKETLIHTIRISLGIETAEKLAEKAGVVNYIAYRAEKGQGIRDENIYKLASALNLSHDILFYSLGKIPKSLLLLIHEDPIYFKIIIDQAYQNPRELNLTKDYIETLKVKMEEIRLKDQENSKDEMTPLLSSLANTSLK